jgi:hypothetical protein
MSAQLDRIWQVAKSGSGNQYGRVNSSFNQPLQSCFALCRTDGQRLTCCTKGSQSRTAITQELMSESTEFFLINRKLIVEGSENRSDESFDHVRPFSEVFISAKNLFNLSCLLLFQAKIPSNRFF